MASASQLDISTASSSSDSEASEYEPDALELALRARDYGDLAEAADLLREVAARGSALVAQGKASREASGSDGEGFVVEEFGEEAEEREEQEDEYPESASESAPFSDAAAEVLHLEHQAAYAAYELAILQHTRGLHAEADILAMRLGMKTRLADSVFCPPPPRDAWNGLSAADDVHPPPPPHLVRVLDDALPVHLFDAVKTAFSDTSCFWQEHNYPCPTFFSYSAPLVSVTATPEERTLRPRKRRRDHGTSLRCPQDDSGGSRGSNATSANDSLFVAPGGALIQAIATAILPTVHDMIMRRRRQSNNLDSVNDEQLSTKRRSEAAATAASGANPKTTTTTTTTTTAVGEDTSRLCSHVEWWAHIRRGQGNGHQMHFDLDEERVHTCDPPPHPAVSCVMYLDAEGGAQTLVTDHHVSVRPTSGTESSSATTTTAAATTTTDTSGTGVSNGAATQGWLCAPKPNRCLLFDGGLLHGVVPTASDAAAQGRTRTTLMLGFWQSPPTRCTPGVDDPFPRPNMARPFFCHDGSASGGESIEGGRVGNAKWPQKFEELAQKIPDTCSDGKKQGRKFAMHTACSTVAVNHASQQSLLRVHPIWVPITAQESEVGPYRYGDASGQRPAPPVTRFLLPDADPFSVRYACLGTHG